MLPRRSLFWPLEPALAPSMGLGRQVEIGRTAKDGLPMPDDPASSADAQEAVPSDEVDRLVDALTAGDHEAATQIFAGRLHETDSFLDTIDGLVQPAMARIGQCWEKGELSVAEEHLASATMQTIVAQNLPDLPVQGSGPGSILLACVQDNDHQLGLRVLSDAFELAGWDVRYLGADVPTEALVAMVERWRPDVVGLSVSMGQHVETARDVVQRVRELGDPQPTLLVGGPLDGHHEEALETTGADAWVSSASEALRVARA